ncbi:DUF1223 domain-containing protein [Shimia abyssi]|uniref:Secreted protein n=1 Tax=Shimia abyssi TaxID=1662395 RepID=A0A2P8FIW2_9RHOB|nr:DUF1223 domain-containing protein [Shimia abyssi]PSL21664.1 hypothetical protein CLV88_10188 [Shimia abyssi]
MIRNIFIAVTLWLSLLSAVQAQNNPVVIELYTSQGCSSCPPADAYLHQNLAKRDDVIALALHVDYWDYIGWKDEFADPANTARQKQYANAAGHRTVYTPQMIINGQDHVVGAHPDKVEKLISVHKDRATPVTLDVKKAGKMVIIQAQTQTPGAMQVHLVQYTPERHVSIKRGENAGKMLTYGNIVNLWETVATWNGQSALSMKAETDGEGPIVVLIQSVKGGPILAAARLD